MSMNAHVNRDIPFMLANLGLTMPNGASRKPDHDRGNEILNRRSTTTSSQEIARRWDPTILNYDVPAGPYDDTTIFQILQGWREQVWRHAEMLVNAPHARGARRRWRDYIEAYALEIGAARSSRARRPTAAARDAHCAAYRAATPRARRPGAGGDRPRAACGARRAAGSRAGGLPGAASARATARSSSTGCAAGGAPARR